MKNCFIISPIGEENSETRKKADLVLKHIVGKAVDENKYRVIRADKLASPGVITIEIIKHLLEDDVVIADLTGSNPNVYYELAIRHASRKPVVHIHTRGESLPFDTAFNRVFAYEMTDVESLDACQQQIRQALSEIESGVQPKTDSISLALQVISFESSHEQNGTPMAQLIESIGEMSAKISRIEQGSQNTDSTAVQRLSKEVQSGGLLPLIEDLDRVEQIRIKGAISMQEAGALRTLILKKMNNLLSR